MCGICGFTSGIFKHENTLSILKKMSITISHRGPDGEGFYTDDYFNCAHRRLSVIDVSEKANQPFSYMQRYICVYNGEIYNYRELKEELIDKGYHFNSESDTEVLIAAFDFYSHKCVEKFNGMWAFAIYDKIEKTVFFSRDRFGIKPLYYAIENGGIIFSSEIKQIKAVLNNKNKIEEEQLKKFLFRGEFDNTEKTMFKGILQLKAGENLKFDLISKKTENHKWYSLEEKISKKESKDKFKGLFLDSLKLRHRSDVPIGYCLSGGLDSSAIVASCDRLFEETKSFVPKCISACYNDKTVDESEYIDIVVNKTNAISYKTYPEFQTLWKEFDNIIYHMDEPFGSSSIFAQWEVFKLSNKQNLTVMLDGQGADEQLAGYNNFFVVLIAEKLKKLKLKSLFEELYIFEKNKSKKVGTSSFVLLLSSIVWMLHPSAFEKIKNRYLGISSKIFNFKISDENKKYNTKNSQYQFAIDCFKNNLSTLLHYEDRMSMAFSIEARVPFLDYRLVEYNINLGIEEKIYKGKTKYNMRSELNDIIPQKILNRTDKIGFATPEKQWIKNNKELFLNELINACDILSDKFINKNEVINYFENVYIKSSVNDFLLFRIISAAKWIKVFEMEI